MRFPTYTQTERQILRIVAAADRPVRISDISIMTRHPYSSAYESIRRALGQLEASGMVRRYRLRYNTGLWTATPAGLGAARCIDAEAA